MTRDVNAANGGASSTSDRVDAAEEAPPPPANRRGSGRGRNNLVCRTDPIDMATGEMVMNAVDVELPGGLPLVIRHHRTSLREGTWFGPSWASTLDQRLVLDKAGAPTDIVHHGGCHLGITAAEGRIVELLLLNAPKQPVLRR